MTTALLLAAKGRNELLSHLLVSDVAPIRGALSSDFIKYINAMHEINVLPHGAVRTRSDVDTRLHLYETVRMINFWSPQLRLRIHHTLGPSHTAVSLDQSFSA